MTKDEIINEFYKRMQEKYYFDPMDPDGRHVQMELKFKELLHLMAELLADKEKK